MTLQLALLATLFALMALDALTTWRVIARGGREGNPVLAKLARLIGFWPATALTKLAIAALAWWTYATTPRALGWLIALVLMYAGAVTWNLRFIARQDAQRRQ